MSRTVGVLCCFSETSLYVPNYPTHLVLQTKRGGSSWTWWFTFIIPTLVRWEQEVKFKASLSYVRTHSLLFPHKWGGGRETKATQELREVRFCFLRLRLLSPGTRVPGFGTQSPAGCATLSCPATLQLQVSFLPSGSLSYPALHTNAPV